MFGDAKVIGNQGVILGNFILIKGGNRNDQRVAKVENRIETQGADSPVSGDKGFTPAKRNRVENVDVADSTKNGKEEKSEANQKPGSGL